MNYPDDDFKAFKAWASDNGVPYQLPTPLSSLLRFIAAMMYAGKSYSTIEHRAFGVSAYNVRHGEPGLAKNDEIKAALTAALLNSEHTARIRKDALLPEGLRTALTAVRSERRTPAALRDVAILTLARATGAKPGALSFLCRGDVRHHGSVMHVRVRRGGEAASWLLVMPDSDSELCAVNAMRDYLAALPAGRGISPLFCSVTKSGDLSTERLRRQGLSMVLKSAARRAGMDPTKFGGQSIRLGRIGETVAKHGPDHQRIAQDVGYSETRHLTPFIQTASARGRRLLEQESI